MTTYYCPRGCQTCDERAAAVVGLECGACGATMTEDSTRYDAVHDIIEQGQIAAFEKVEKLHTDAMNAMQNAFCGKGDRETATALMLDYLEALTPEGRHHEWTELTRANRAFDDDWRQWFEQNSILPRPVCIGCNRHPDEIAEIAYMVKSAAITADEFVRRQEGTYNPANGHFACDECYTAMGSPSRRHPASGWKAP